ncbi:S9 family peptidase [Virgibacillus sediminis]|uniref:Prolyl oligopeptidase family serine peptidase n=1 Tax=Virgibacillus sediminis TaxID=202260 RepID=A0ABV7A4M0_9BACI
MPANKRAMKADDFKRLDVFSDPNFTPDGKAYTYTATTVNEENEYVSNLFFHDLEGQQPVPWTFGTNKNSHLRFSPDGSKAVFQSTRTGLPQIWLLSTAGGEAKQLTEFKHGAANPAWAENGRSILFSAPLEADADVSSQRELTKEERQKEAEQKKKQPLVVNRLKYKSDAKGFHDNKRTQLVRFDLENETFIQLTSADADHSYQDISADGRYVLFAANLSDEADFEQSNHLFLLDSATKEISNLTNGKGSCHSAAFSPDGKKIAYLGHGFEYDGATLNELFIHDLDSGERACLSGEWDMQLGDILIGDSRLGEANTGPVWSQDNSSLFFIATDHGTTGLYQATLEKELNVLYKEDNHVFSFAYHGETEEFILGISTPSDPCNFYKLSKGVELKRLTNANAAFLDEVSVSAPETLSITANDGWILQGWLLRPYGFEQGKKYPFILEIHGGPHAMYGQTFFHEMQLLAAKGYVVLYINPRGSHGYGQEFVGAVRSDYGGKDYEDLMNAVDYALEHFSFIDETRLGVTGGSYGGFMTNWVVSHTNRFKAAVTQRSISNWLSFYGVSDIGYFFTKWELGHNLLDDPEKLWDFSPLKYAANVETPLLILHGEQDYRCPIEQGEQLFVTLKHQRKEVEFVRFPDASHELSRSGRPDLRVERLNHICRWFEEYL